MKSLKRRVFIKKSMVVSAGVALGAPAYIKGYAQIQPSDIINVAVAGINGRGGTHYSNFTRIKESRVVAICDPVDYLFPEAIAAIEKLGGAKPRTVVDFRDLLDDKEIDAVSIATPGYWHALMTIWACQAGKDVYVEKPISYTIEEGRKMVQAARKYNRIVQAGMNRRTSRVSQKGIQLLHDGVIGDIYMGRGTVYRLRSSIGRVKDSSVPAGVNWDLFRGPAPMIPFNENHFLYNWHWYWDTSTSEFGNNGIHCMDRIRTGMNKNVHPTKITCCGGFYAWDSDQQIPNLEVATFEYSDKTIMELEVRSLPNPGGDDFIWLGTKGYATLSGSSFQTFVPAPRAVTPAPAAAITAPAAAGRGTTPPAAPPSTAATSVATETIQRAAGPTPTLSITNADLPIDTRRDELDKAQIEYHFQNFLDCMRSRKIQDLVADILEGHMSTSIMHLGNIAYRTKRKLTFNVQAEQFVNDDDANTYLTRKDGYRSPYLLPKEV